MCSKNIYRAKEQAIGNIDRATTNVRRAKEKLFNIYERLFLNQFALGFAAARRKTLSNYDLVALEQK